MKRLLYPLCALAGLGLLLSSTSHAQTHRRTAVVALHIDEFKKADKCTPETPDLAQDVTCTLITDEAPSGDTYLVYVLFGAFFVSNGGSAVEFSINYEPGLVVNTWSNCTDGEFASTAWPETGSGNLVLWESDPENEACALEALNVMGYFELTAYDPGVMWIGPRPATGQLALFNCSNHTELMDPVADAGVASFGGSAPGCNPCLEPCWGGVPVEKTTWGAIKAINRFD